jgi:hypothetical protein
LSVPSFFPLFSQADDAAVSLLVVAFAAVDVVVGASAVFV